MSIIEDTNSYGKELYTNLTDWSTYFGFIVQFLFCYCKDYLQLYILSCKLLIDDHNIYFLLNNTHVQLDLYHYIACITVSNINLEYELITSYSLNMSPGHKALEASILNIG